MTNTTITINILDYVDRPTPVTINLDDIRRIEMMVLSGDEVLLVEHMPGGPTLADIYDSCKDRCQDFFDDRYTIYDKDLGINLLKEDWFINRANSYDVGENHPEVY